MHPQDAVRFAFTVPSINHVEPDERFEWVVLPQGMANSPTMCQLYVDSALKGVRDQFPRLKCYHYMDDILLAAPTEEMLEHAYRVVIPKIKRKAIGCSPVKVSERKSGKLFRTKIFDSQVSPQKIQIQTDNLRTLNDFPKLLGDIQWVCPSLFGPNQQTITAII